MIDNPDQIDSDGDGRGDACHSDDGTWTYGLNGDGATITGCVETCPSNLVIPDSVSGYSVTRISDWAFDNNQLTSITIPGSVTSIRSRAFEINLLTSVHFLGDRPEPLVADSFLNNPNLTTITYCAIRGGWPGEAISNGTDDITPVGVDCDSDGDGTNDSMDVFAFDPLEQTDHDADGLGDNGDNCPILVNVDQVNTDGDAEGDACDADDDNDGYSDEQEAIDGTDPLNPFSCSQGCFSFDIDADEKLAADALTDGLLVIRYLFGFSGDALIADATSNDATRQDASEITSYLNDAESELDIDGDGDAGALTDGLILIRYLFGFSGDALISGAVSANAERTSAEQIEAYISERIPTL
jgi:hypothetical protein